MKNIEIDIPRVNIGDLEEIAKNNLTVIFTQMRLANEDYTRFASFSINHKDMVTNFFREIGKFIPEPYLKVCQSESPCPVLRLGDYELIGMGSAIINAERKELIYQEPSRDFRLALNRQTARKMQPFMNGWFLH